MEKTAVVIIVIVIMARSLPAGFFPEISSD
jgi:hypothetical protein